MKTQFISIISLQSKIDFKNVAINIEPEKNEIIENEIIEENNIDDNDLDDDNIQENNHWENTYENFNVTKLQKLQSFNTKYKIETLLVLNDGRILTQQCYSDENSEDYYKLCVYSTKNGFMCDINIDYEYIRDIYQMDDGNIIIFTSDSKNDNIIDIIKIKKSSIENIWNFEKNAKLEKKLLKNTFCLDVEKKKKGAGGFFGVVTLYTKELYKYDKGQLIQYKNIEKLYKKEGIENICQVNENEFIFYSRLKGKIYGKNDYLIFYDMAKDEKIKTLKVGGGENLNGMLLVSKDILIIQGNEKIKLIDIPNKRIIKKINKYFDLEIEVLLLNQKSFLYYEKRHLKQYEIDDSKDLKLKGNIRYDDDFIFKYPDNKFITYSDNEITIYG